MSRPSRHLPSIRPAGWSAGPRATCSSHSTTVCRGGRRDPDRRSTGQRGSYYERCPGRGADGLWWYPITAAPSRIESDGVFSVATLGDGAVVLGADSAGTPGSAPSTPPTRGYLCGVAAGHRRAPCHRGGVAGQRRRRAIAFAGPSSVLRSPSSPAEPPFGRPATSGNRRSRNRNAATSTRNRSAPNLLPPGC